MQHGTSLPGLEPGASGLEVQRAIPLRHRDYASTVKVWYIFPSISLRIASSASLQHQDQSGQATTSDHTGALLPLVELTRRAEV